MFLNHRGQISSQKKGVSPRENPFGGPKGGNFSPAAQKKGGAKYWAPPGGGAPLFHKEDPPLSGGAHTTPGGAPTSGLHNKRPPQKRKNRLRPERYLPSRTYSRGGINSAHTHILPERHREVPPFFFFYFIYYIFFFILSPHKRHDTTTTPTHT